MRIHTWEYKTLIIDRPINSSDFLDILNNLGALGWEPCADPALTCLDLSDYAENVYHLLLFKRPTGYIDYDVVNSDPGEYYK